MSTRLSLFDSPLFLGFDHFERTFDRIKKSGSEGYPPYNIEQIGENGLRISLAVAGFTMDDLDVQIDQNQLTIRGKQEDDEERIYLHRGIASRQFQRTFVLADGIEITGATLYNGLLHIDMERVMPEPKARKIEIKGGQTNAGKNENTARSIDVNREDSTSGADESKSHEKISEEVDA